MGAEHRCGAGGGRLQGCLGKSQSPWKARAGSREGNWCLLKLKPTLGWEGGVAGSNFSQLQLPPSVAPSRLLLTTHLQPQCSKSGTSHLSP